MKVWLWVLLALVAGLVMVISVLVIPVNYGGVTTGSVVCVYNDSGFGSGVVVGSMTVLTARHVAELFDPTVPLFIQTQDNDEPRRVIGFVADPDVDTALIFVDPNCPFDVNEPAAPVCFDPLRLGDLVTVVGTPFTLELYNCALPGTVVKVDVDAPTPGGKQLDILDVHAGSGCSGGPVYDSRGRVRGVLIVTIGGLAGAVPTTESEGLLKDVTVAGGF